MKISKGKKDDEVQGVIAPAPTQPIVEPEEVQGVIIEDEVDVEDNSSKHVKPGGVTLPEPGQII